MIIDGTAPPLPAACGGTARHPVTRVSIGGARPRELLAASRGGAATSFLAVRAVGDGRGRAEGVRPSPSRRGGGGGGGGALPRLWFQISHPTLDEGHLGEHVIEDLVLHPAEAPRAAVRGTETGRRNNAVDGKATDWLNDKESEKQAEHRWTDKETDQPTKGRTITPPVCGRARPPPPRRGPG